MFVFLNWRPRFVVVCVRRLRSSVDRAAVTKIAEKCQSRVQRIVALVLNMIYCYCYSLL